MKTKDYRGSTLHSLFLSVHYFYVEYVEIMENSRNVVPREDLSNYVPLILNDDITDITYLFDPKLIPDGHPFDILLKNNNLDKNKIGYQVQLNTTYSKLLEAYSNMLPLLRLYPHLFLLPPPDSLFMFYTPKQIYILLTSVQEIFLEIFIHMLPVYNKEFDELNEMLLTIFKEFGSKNQSIYENFLFDLLKTGETTDIEIIQETKKRLQGGYNIYQHGGNNPSDVIKTALKGELKKKVSSLQKQSTYERDFDIFIKKIMEDGLENEYLTSKKGIIYTTYTFREEKKEELWANFIKFHKQKGVNTSKEQYTPAVVPIKSRLQPTTRFTGTEIISLKQPYIQYEKVIIPSDVLKGLINEETLIDIRNKTGLSNEEILDQIYSDLVKKMTNFFTSPEKREDMKEDLKDGLLQNLTDVLHSGKSIIQLADSTYLPYSNFLEKMNTNIYYPRNTRWNLAKSVSTRSKKSLKELLTSGDVNKVKTAIKYLDDNKIYGTFDYIYDATSTAFDYPGRTLILSICVYGVVKSIFNIDSLFQDKVRAFHNKVLYQKSTKHGLVLDDKTYPWLLKDSNIEILYYDMDNNLIPVEEYTDERVVRPFKDLPQEATLRGSWQKTAVTDRSHITGEPGVIFVEFRRVISPTPTPTPPPKPSATPSVMPSVMPSPLASALASTNFVDIHQLHKNGTLILSSKSSLEARAEPGGIFSKPLMGQQLNQLPPTQLTTLEGKIVNKQLAQICESPGKAISEKWGYQESIGASSLVTGAILSRFSATRAYGVSAMGLGVMALNNVPGNIYDVVSQCTPYYIENILESNITSGGVSAAIGILGLIATYHVGKPLYDKYKEKQKITTIQKGAYNAFLTSKKNFEKIIIDQILQDMYDKLKELTTNLENEGKLDPNKTIDLLINAVVTDVVSEANQSRFIIEGIAEKLKKEIDKYNRLPDKKGKTLLSYLSLSGVFDGYINYLFTNIIIKARQKYLQKLLKNLSELNLSEQANLRNIEIPRTINIRDKEALQQQVALIKEQERRTQQRKNTRTQLLDLQNTNPQGIRNLVTNFNIYNFYNSINISDTKYTQQITDTIRIQSAIDAYNSPTESLQNSLKKTLRTIGAKNSNIITTQTMDKQIKDTTLLLNLVNKVRTTTGSSFGNEIIQDTFEQAVNIVKNVPLLLQNGPGTVHNPINVNRRNGTGNGNGTGTGTGVGLSPNTNRLTTLSVAPGSGSGTGTGNGIPIPTNGAVVASGTASGTSPAGTGGRRKTRHRRFKKITKKHKTRKYHGKKRATRKMRKIRKVKKGRYTRK